jgi:hypothetical protein
MGEENESKNKTFILQAARQIADSMQDENNPYAAQYRKTRGLRKKSNKKAHFFSASTGKTDPSELAANVTALLEAVGGLTSESLYRHDFEGRFVADQSVRLRSARVHAGPSCYDVRFGSRAGFDLKAARPNGQS